MPSSTLDTNSVELNAYSHVLRYTASELSPHRTHKIAGFVPERVTVYYILILCGFNASFRNTALSAIFYRRIPSEDRSTSSAGVTTAVRAPIRTKSVLVRKWDATLVNYLKQALERLPSQVNRGIGALYEYMGATRYQTSGPYH